jgi:hypothetical protein
MTPSDGSLMGLAGIRFSIQTVDPIGHAAADIVPIKADVGHHRGSAGTIWLERTGRERNIIATTSLTRRTITRRLSTAPIADSQRLTARCSKTCARADSQRRWSRSRAEKQPAKTREELESAIRVEMDDISSGPTDLAISVVPHEDTWKVEIMKGHSRTSIVQI